MRAIAVILVLIDHTIVVAPEWAGSLPHGSLGVDVFFVLSGFLITALLLRDDGEGHVRFWPFYRRRAMRLLPALYAVVFVYWFYAMVTDLATRNLEPVLVSILFYYRNWLMQIDTVRDDVVPGMGHMWSLAVEEQFYLVWPAVTALFLGFRRRLSVIVTVLVVGILVVDVHRALLWEHGANFLRLGVRTDARADSILIGALIAHLWVRYKTPVRHTAIPACVATVVFAICLFHVSGMSFYLDGGLTLVAACVGVVMLALLADNWFAWPFKLGWLRAIGRVSYGLYLWHFPIFYVVAATRRTSISFPDWSSRTA